MFKLWKNIFSNYSNSIPDIFSPKYEEYLLKQYGNADKINNSISLLVIADTHGTLDEDKFKQYLADKQTAMLLMATSDAKNVIDEQFHSSSEMPQTNERLKLWEKLSICSWH